MSDMTGPSLKGTPMTTDHPPSPHPRTFRMILPDNRARCDRCGGSMPPGTVIAATVVALCEPLVLVHDGGCPPAWTPTVVDGARRTRSEARKRGQQSLFVAAVEGGER